MMISILVITQTESRLNKLSLNNYILYLFNSILFLYILYFILYYKYKS
jgi:hypothetical protein